MTVKLPEKTGRDYQILWYYEAWAWKLDGIEYSAVQGHFLTTVYDWAVTGDRQMVPSRKSNRQVTEPFSE